MRRIFLLWPMSLTLFVIPAQAYKHKSEAELAQMTPAQRVNVFVEENVHHRYNLDDDSEVWTHL